MAPANTLDRAELHFFTGGGDQFRHKFNRLIYTEGMKHVADRYGAYWLIDAIASYQSKKLEDSCGWMQCWTLEVRDDRSATLICRRDKGEPEQVRQEIEYSDFPATGSEPFALWVCHGVLMLPTEY